MGTTSVDLFRSGNSQHARLHEVRTAERNPGADPDVDTYVEPISQNIWVSAAHANGASSWEVLDQAWRKPWRLPAGATFPDSLRLWKDDSPPGHWTWAPAQNMPIDAYIDALATVNAQFVPA